MIRSQQLERIVARIRDAFEIPSVSAAFYINGMIYICSSGCYDDTLFAIGSCTKSFTAGTVLALQDRGMLSVNDTVLKHIPDFALSVPEVARSLTIRDILSHRSGFPGCDLAWYSRHDAFPVKELMRAISLLPATAKPGEKHQYNNMMFALAGTVIEECSGISWKEAVESFLFKPLGIEKAAFSCDEAMKLGAVAVPYIRSGSGTVAVPHARLGAVSPAGCLYMTAGELLKWNIAIMNGGTLEGKDILSSDAIREMTLPCVSDGYDGLLPELSTAVKDRCYALGLQTELFRGEKLIFHGGAIDGFLANQNILPGRNCAAVMLTDLGGTLVREAFQYAFNGLLLGDETDWIGLFAALQQKMLEEYSPLLYMNGIPGDCEACHILSGRYTNPLFGELVLSSASGSFTARIGDLEMPVIATEDTVSFFHPYFGLLEAEHIIDDSGSVIALELPADPEIDMKFRFTRQ